MLKDSISTSAFQAWVTSKGLNLPVDTTATTLYSQDERDILSLCANVSPSKDSEQLLLALNDALVAAHHSGLSDFAPVQALVTDQRLPGWLRLGAALFLDDREAVISLARYTPLLAEHFKDLHSDYWQTPSAAFSALSPTRRFRLLNAGMRAHTYFTPEEVVKALKETEASTWSVKASDLMYTVEWGEDFSEAIAELEVISKLMKLKPLDKFVMAARIFASTGRSRAPFTELRESLETMASILNQVEKKQWPTKTYDLESKEAASILLLLPGVSKASNYRHLGALCARQTHPSFDGPDPILLSALAHPDSSWVIPTLIGINDTELHLIIIKELLKDSEGNRSVIKQLLGTLTFSGAGGWVSSPVTEEIFKDLGDLAPLLLEAPLAEFQRAFGGYAVGDTINYFPAWMVEAIAAFKEEENRGTAKAHAYMIECHYEPKTTTVLSNYDTSPLNTALSALFLDADLGNGSSAAHKSAVAWVRRMSTSQLALLIEKSIDFKSQNGGTADVPLPITQVIEEALSLCSSEQAKEAIVAALIQEEPLTNQSVTFLTFAKEISNTFEKTLS